MTSSAGAHPLEQGKRPGRNCPVHYRYRPEVFAGEASAAFRDIEVLYVVGGLYGNELALQSVLALFDAERGRKRLVFNGDFHWFDADPQTFENAQRAVLAHTALRGNVETELAAAESTATSDAGCGCAYPAWVHDDVVERSNRILKRLQSVASAAQRSELNALPMWQRVDVGPMRVAVVHGDAESLAGWGFSQESLLEPAQRERARHWFAAAKVDAFACTHTCLPVYQPLRVPDRDAPCWILNNGAAGMPNFSGDGVGLFTRIAVYPPRMERRFGTRHGDIFIDASAIRTDAAEVRRRFLAQWPQGSDAYASYFERIERGPSYTVQQAMRAPG